MSSSRPNKTYVINTWFLHYSRTNHNIVLFSSRTSFIPIWLHLELDIGRLGIDLGSIQFNHSIEMDHNSNVIVWMAIVFPFRIITSHQIQYLCLVAHKHRIGTSSPITAGEGGGGSSGRGASRAHSSPRRGRTDREEQPQRGMSPTQRGEIESAIEGRKRSIRTCRQRRGTGSLWRVAGRELEGRCGLLLPLWHGLCLYLWRSRRREMVGRHGS
jgi:hypothetical protein